MSNQPNVFQGSPYERQEGISHQEPGSVKERLTACIPASPKMFVFVLAMIVCLIVGVVNLAFTGNFWLLIWVLGFAATGVGIKPPQLFPMGKEGLNHPPEINKGK